MRKAVLLAVLTLYLTGCRAPANEGSPGMVEGGVPFNTSMPPWKALDEQSRWDLINCIRSLGE